MLAREAQPNGRFIIANQDGREGLMHPLLVNSKLRDPQNWPSTRNPEVDPHAALAPSRLP